MQETVVLMECLIINKHMGISIHYNGKFNKDIALSKLIEEVKDIASTLKWDYTVFEEIFKPSYTYKEEHDGNLYGICFAPPECEPVWLSFLSNYRMSGALQLKFNGDAKDKLESDYLYKLATKTQFAGTAIHKTIVHFLSYLNDKGYFEELNIKDEGEYWETRNEDLLEAKFKQNGELIENFTLACKAIPTKEEESYENYFKRIVKIIDERRKNT